MKTLAKQYTVVEQNYVHVLYKHAKNESRHMLMCWLPRNHRCNKLSVPMCYLQYINQQVSSSTKLLYVVSPATLPHT